MEMKFFNTEETRAALPFSKLIPALKTMFQQECTVPRRHIHEVRASDNPLTTLIMPAWSEAGYMGIKTVNIAPQNSRNNLPGLFSTYLLYDVVTGQPIAQMDGNEITSRRTAAASALGASFLARPDARRLTVLGTGRVGRLIPHAYQAVLPIEEVKVWNIRPESAIQMVQALNQAGIEASVANDLEQAVRWADVVSCATLSTTPLVKGDWLQPGSHLDLIGSFAPGMRESDTKAIIQASLFIDTQEAMEKSGDLLAPIVSQQLKNEDVIGTLADLCRNQCRARASDEERTVFKAVGTALEDLAAASLVYRDFGKESK
ncbi:ornithine cyclodeaminase family protein [Photobacterium sp. 1_MG-2023]|uniref:ornithine cyclodeaminase family protein n=1 Tax=Photobacterium sp. 1_MG-2023 TaxID=3062646 RepID=UPI0026E2874B|nr:ornithine cyclodeaminase family protein [Photobacterium sp. 1_MG-2023]MDO6708665.1 ornithine cyclodeaminase family protein [Photobacterium sp. 1_MG-2023]